MRLKGYFKKQGFSKSIKMPSDRWKGYKICFKYALKELDSLKNMMVVHSWSAIFILKLIITIFRI